MKRALSAMDKPIEEYLLAGYRIHPQLNFNVIQGVQMELHNHTIKGSQLDLTPISIKATISKQENYLAEHPTCLRKMH